jgi:hypothetical protein
MSAPAVMAPSVTAPASAATQAPPPKPVDRRQYVIVAILGIALVGALAFLVLNYGQPADTTKAQAAAGILALIAALAIAIERVLEGFWTLVDVLAANPSWPFSKDADLLEQLAEHLTTFVKAPLGKINDSLKAGDAMATKLLNEKPDAQRQVDDLLSSVNNILGSSKSPKKSRSLTAIQLGLSDLSKTLSSESVGADLNLGVSVLDTLSGWIDTLVANPGRKIMSLFAGVVIGLAAAWLFGLDLVHAALSIATPPGLEWGMVLTGVAVGLGSNPTHELIKAIQTYKQQQQGS